MIKQIDKIGEPYILDFHSHVLPRIDDGSDSAELSVAMLDMLASQGVKRVVATPHFNASLHSPAEFLKKRSESEKLLANALSGRAADTYPKLYMGAEVAYFYGMSRSEVLASLCVSGTDLLLVEMPFSTWDSSMVDEILSIRDSLGITPVLAHVERYFSFQKKKTFEILLSGGVLLQVNAEAFLSFRTRGRVLKMLENGEIAFVGSDCHDTVNRAPNFDKAMKIISKKSSEAFFELCAQGNSAFDYFDKKGENNE